ncbi:rhamnan synthesis F family protein [Turicimonas sp. TL08]
MRRACLFAGFNPTKWISGYVFNYLRELSNYCEIFYLCDGQLEKGELDKLKGLVKKAANISHGKYDFGSYSLLAQKIVGWEELKNYDEVVFANDSCLCVNSLSKVFSHFERKEDLDFWALLGTDENNTKQVFNFQEYWNSSIISSTFCLGSYFLVFRKRCLTDPAVRSFFMDCNRFSDRNDVCLFCEYGLTQLLHYKGFKGDTYLPNIYRFSSTYMLESLNLIKKNFPLLKVRIFIDNIGGEKNIELLAASVEKYCDFPFINLVKDIKEERNVKKKASLPAYQKDKPKKALHLLLPVPFHYALQTLWRDYSGRSGVINKLRFFYPPCFSYAKRGLSYLFKRKGSKNNFRFVLLPMPEEDSYLPNHIKDYKKDQQEKILKYKDMDNLMIFFNFSRNTVSGGMLSINRFATYLRNKGYENVVQCGVPFQNATINNDYFNYGTDFLDFNLLIETCFPQKVQLNIPEVFIPIFLSSLTVKMEEWLWSRKELRINILNQSDVLMPSNLWIERLRTLCNGRLTITAAHEKYCTESKEKEYRTNIYLLTPFLPEFHPIPFYEKRKKILYSPDHHPFKEKIIGRIRAECPDFELKEIKNMTLEKYKAEIAEAFFVITFGEGYDGYFIEPYLSGTISFSVFNRIFFPQSFECPSTVFKDYENMLQGIVPMIKKLTNDTELYRKLVKVGEKEVRKFTNNDRSERDMGEFLERYENELKCY